MKKSTTSAQIKEVPPHSPLLAVLYVVLIGIVAAVIAFLLVTNFIGNSALNLIPNG